MNEDMQILAMLFHSSQRRMVAVVSQVEARLGQSAGDIQASLARLERRGLLYVEGPTVRLTLAGLAQAVAFAPQGAEVHRLGKRPHPVRSHAA